MAAVAVALVAEETGVADAGEGSETVPTEASGTVCDAVAVDSAGADGVDVLRGASSATGVAVTLADTVAGENAPPPGAAVAGLVGVALAEAAGVTLPEAVGAAAAAGA